jgi:hypothetical protein
VNYSKGISWIDDCRIPFVDDESLTRDFKVGGNTLGAGQYGLNDGRKTKPTNKLEGTLWENTQGRFPANILVSDDMLNDGVISKSNDHKWEGEDTSPIYGKYENRTRTQVYSDKGSNSRYYDIDKWFNNLIDV